MRILVLLCVLIVLCACTPKAPEFTEADKTEIVNLIEANMDKLVASANAMNTSALEEFLKPGPEKSFYMAGASYTKDELISTTKDEYAKYASQTLTVKVKNCKVLSPESVLLTAIIAAGSTDKEGKDYTLSFTDTWLWEKQGDTWQVTHLHESWN